jgi:murein tripeptide amidase MpaA
VQAGIHAGEIDGKDAVFLLLKDIAEGKIENPLQGIHLVFIPAVNLDGHERRGRWNRPNQVGPEEMGWRVTSQNLNMNRDFMKLDASETRDLLKLWHEIDPILSLDLHATNGAQFQPEVGLIILPNIYHESGPLHQAGSDFEVALLEKMKQKKHLPLSFYPTFEEYENPLSEWREKSLYLALPMAIGIAIIVLECWLKLTRGKIMPLG